MPLSEIHELALDMAKGLKEATVENDGGKSDIHPQMICYRGYEPVAMVLLRDHIRDQILQTFRFCAWGFAADTIATMFETYMAVYGGGDSRDAATQGLNPRTGKPWGEGGMQREAEFFQGVEKGLVTEAIAVTTVNRAGDAAFGTMPFHYDRKRLVWDEPGTLSSVEGENAVKGRMIRHMTKAMNMPPVEAVQRELALRTTIHERDVWTTKFLMGNLDCQIVLISTDDPERVETISKAGEPLL